jgi:hypothetical protein
MERKRWYQLGLKVPKVKNPDGVKKAKKVKNTTEEVQLFRIYIIYLFLHCFAFVLFILFTFHDDFLSVEATMFYFIIFIPLFTTDLFMHPFVFLICLFIYLFIYLVDYFPDHLQNKILNKLSVVSYLP